MVQAEQINVVIVIGLLGILINILLYIFLKDRIHELYNPTNGNGSEQSLETVNSRATI